MTLPKINNSTLVSPIKSGLLAKIRPIAICRRFFSYMGRFIN